VVSSVSDRDDATLRELQRLGVMPGVGVLIEPGNRNGSLLIKIRAGKQPVRLSQKLAAAISVAAAPPARKST